GHGERQLDATTEHAHTVSSPRRSRQWRRPPRIVSLLPSRLFSQTGPVLATVSAPDHGRPAVLRRCLRVGLSIPGLPHGKAMRGAGHAAGASGDGRPSPRRRRPLFDAWRHPPRPSTGLGTVHAHVAGTMWAASAFVAGTMWAASAFVAGTMWAASVVLSD